MGTERIEGYLAALRKVRGSAHRYPYTENTLVVGIERIDELIALAEIEFYSVTPERIYDKRTHGLPEEGVCCVHDIPIGLLCEICQGRWPTES